jgi:hypothetical protein
MRDLSKSRLLWIAEGLRILAPHCSDFDVCAEHDELFACYKGTELSPEDHQRMIDLGWDWSKGTGWSFFV